MLCLKRKTGEQIFIGDGVNQIAIKVLECRNGDVRLGIEAPRNVSVDRAEVRAAKIANPRLNGLTVVNGNGRPCFRKAS